MLTVGRYFEQVNPLNQMLWGMSMLLQCQNETSSPDKKNDRMIILLTHQKNSVG